MGSHLRPVVFNDSTTAEGTTAAKTVVKCTLCEAKGQSVVTMIPGADRCDNSWTLQYKGALVAPPYGRTFSFAVCLDITSHQNELDNNETPYPELYEKTSYFYVGLKGIRNFAGDENRIMCVVCTK